MGEFISILRDNGMLLLVGQYPSGPLGGVAITLALSALGLILAFPLGVLVALARTSPIIPLRKAAIVLVTVVRGVPLVMFIFWVYFFVPILTGKTVSGFTTMLLTLVFYEAAYLAEIIRAGIEGLSGGQTEAARAIGLNYWQTTTRIVLPQALYNMIPAIMGQFVSAIKDTSLAYVISVNELTFAANQVNNSLLTQPFRVYLILALAYFVICSALTQLARTVERRIARRRTGQSSDAQSASPLQVARATA